MTKEKIKEKIEEDKEESELEEVLEDSEEELKIDTSKFIDKLININPNSASLEQVAISKGTDFSLETGLAEAPMTKEDDEEIKYNAINYDKSKEKSYAEKQEVRSENLIVNTPLSRARDNPVDFSQQKTELDVQYNPEIGDTSKSHDDFVVKAQRNFEEFKTQDPFQKNKNLQEDYFNNLT